MAEEEDEIDLTSAAEAFELGIVIDIDIFESNSVQSDLFQNIVKGNIGQ